MSLEIRHLRITEHTMYFTEKGGIENQQAARFVTRSEHLFWGSRTDLVCNPRWFVPSLQGFVSTRREIVASFRKGWSKPVSPPDEGTFDEAIAQPGAQENHDRAERRCPQDRKVRLGRNGEKLLPQVE